MQKLADDFILYHGSYCEVRQPQLECQVAVAAELMQLIEWYYKEWLDENH